MQLRKKIDWKKSKELLESKGKKWALNRHLDTPPSTKDEISGEKIFFIQSYLLQIKRELDYSDMPDLY